MPLTCNVSSGFVRIRQNSQPSTLARLMAPPPRRGCHETRRDHGRKIMPATAIINRVPGAGERYRPSRRAGAHRVRSVIDAEGGCFAVGHARRPKGTLGKLRDVLAQVRRTFGSNVLVVGKELSKDVSQGSQSTFRIIVDLVRFDAQISLLFVITVAVVSTSTLGYIGVW